MKKVAIVSCDKWIDKLEEDKNLKKTLIDLGIDAKIISWQKPFDNDYDLLVMRSVWGYQNFYNEFKEWLLYLKKNNINIHNNVDLILSNIRKDIQFEILKKNDIELIDTIFIDDLEMINENILDMFNNNNYVLKPTISGSGENTYLINNSKNIIQNSIDKNDIYNVYSKLLSENLDCKLMIQPYIHEINNGEYSCIFIDGKLTHTMLRFPNIFHEKKKPYFINNVPESVLNLAKKVEQIPDFKNYLYMRVDMVIINGKAKIMEVELTEPDLLTKYILDNNIKTDVIKTFAKKIERRIK